MWEKRKYVIFASSELGSIDFSQVRENSSSTVRKSADETKTFVKWDGDTVPSSVSGLSTYQGPYSHSQIKEILSTEEWVGIGTTGE